MLNLLLNTKLLGVQKVIGNEFSHVLPLCMFAGYNDFLALLDKRYSNKAKQEGGQMAKKIRKTGSLSDASPPFGTPKWMIEAEFEGKKKHLQSIPINSLMCTYKYYKYVLVL